jgi:hypothetical protein
MRDLWGQVVSMSPKMRFVGLLSTFRGAAARLARRSDERLARHDPAETRSGWCRTRERSREAGLMVRSDSRKHPSRPFLSYDPSRVTMCSTWPRGEHFCSGLVCTDSPSLATQVGLVCRSWSEANGRSQPVAAAATSSEPDRGVLEPTGPDLVTRSLVHGPLSPWN